MEKTSCSSHIQKKTGESEGAVVEFEEPSTSFKGRMEIKLVKNKPS
jgi:hypothetical protein